MRQLFYNYMIGFYYLKINEKKEVTSLLSKKAEGLVIMQIHRGCQGAHPVNSNEITLVRKSISPEASKCEVPVCK